MKQKSLFLILFLWVQICSAVGPWEIEVKDIKKDSSGNFQLSYIRHPFGGQEENISLEDNDGIATLATTQLMMVSKVDGAESDLDTPLAKLLPDGGTRILRLQRDALEKLIVSLEEVCGPIKGSPSSIRLGGTDLNMEEAIQLAKGLLARFSAKHLWTLRDIRERGKIIQKFVGAGGSYLSRKMVNGQEVSTTVYLEDKKDPQKSFLSGWVANGIYSLPSAISKSHVWITGDLARLAQSYEIGTQENFRNSSPAKIAHQ